MRFITDPGLRDDLRIDIGAVNRALSNAEWKAATVLAGAVVEALLLWALQQKILVDIQKAVASAFSRNAPKNGTMVDLLDWHLPHYLETTAQLGIIKSDTAQQARLAKDYRNLIHAGRMVSRGQRCDRRTALAAVAALEAVVSDLTP